MDRLKLSTATFLSFALFASPALADPKPEAMDAMKWGLDYCKDGLKPERDPEETQEFYSKFQARLKTAVAADPNIRTYGGEIRGMKVSEWISKCEKELPAKVQTQTQTRALTTALTNAYGRCDSARENSTVFDLDESVKSFATLKAAAITANNGPTFTIKFEGDDPAKHFAACEKQMSDRRAMLVKRDSDVATARSADAKKFSEEQAARREAEAAKLKQRRASLKGDRGRIYDKYGEPTNWDGDLDKTPEWRWHLTKTKRGIEGDCVTVVKFKGMKKVSETQTSECKW